MIPAVMTMRVFVVLLLLVPGVTAHGILTIPVPRDGTEIAGGNKGESFDLSQLE